MPDCTVAHKARDCSPWSLEHHARPTCPAHLLMADHLVLSGANNCWHHGKRPWLKGRWCHSIIAAVTCSIMRCFTFMVHGPPQWTYPLLWGSRDDSSCAAAADTHQRAGEGTGGRSARPPAAAGSQRGRLGVAQQGPGDARQPSGRRHAVPAQRPGMWPRFSSRRTCTSVCGLPVVLVVTLSTCWGGPCSWAAQVRMLVGAGQVWELAQMAGT